MDYNLLQIVANERLFRVGYSAAMNLSHCYAMKAIIQSDLLPRWSRRRAYISLLLRVPGYVSSAQLKH